MNSDLKFFLNMPLVIGNKQIEKRLMLAPMAGLGNIAYRELLASYGGYGLMFTGMCSAKAVPTENRYTSNVFKWRDDELNYLVCQIFGSDPEYMAIAAQRIEKEGFFGVDINMGCSVRAICNKNCGAALLKNPDLAVSIVKTVREAVSIPLFVKFRTGWKNDPLFPVELARKFESVGADALTFHPRVAPDRRLRSPKWDYIKNVKKAVAIPVFGNGNVFDKDDCRRMIDQTHCDGVALGRIAIAKPWLFSEITEEYSPDGELYQKCAMKMVTSLEDHFDSIMSVKYFKIFLLYFSTNFKFGLKIYSRLSKGNNMDDLKKNIETIFKETPELTQRPNMNLFT